jgi:hypothetical protein
VSLKITHFCDEMPCSPVHVYISVEIAAYHKDRRWQQVPAVMFVHIYDTRWHHQTVTFTAAPLFKGFKAVTNI